MIVEANDQVNKEISKVIKKWETIEKYRKLNEE